jgi:hypothetical protein
MEEADVVKFFYSERHALTLNTAEAVLSIVCATFGPPNSVLDVGCGVGTWLYAAKAKGASRVRGIEGAWINEIQELAVPRESIDSIDLEAGWNADQDFDLSISLEVAEHLSPAAGSRLVDQLCFASPLVLFSAAVPGQGGNGHVNEQWPNYWQKQFAKNRYRSIDCVRPVIWNNENIPWWYRQNILIYINEDIARAYYLAMATKSASEDLPALGVLHPTPYIEQNITPKSPLWRRIAKKIRHSLRRRYSAEPTL